MIQLFSYIKVTLLCVFALVMQMQVGFAQSQPDEFSVIPAKPLVSSPDGLNGSIALPIPTPGGRNRTDITPVRGAISKLGGDFAQGIDAREDPAFMASISAYGIDAQARQDASIAFNSSSVVQGGGQKLDAYAEAQRFQRLGLQTPSAPPQ